MPAMTINVFMLASVYASLGFRLHVTRHGAYDAAAWHAPVHDRGSGMPYSRHRVGRSRPALSKQARATASVRCLHPTLSVGEATSVQEREQSDLFDSFPKIRQLPPLAPMEQWNTTRLTPLPPKIYNGVLDNGLTYFVQENREPKSRAELNLIVGFGSLVEEEEERGIAHIIEHLGFSATKSYENFAIIKFLESIGAPFGACQNAYTGFDRTVYTLHVPTDSLNESLKVLNEFAYYTRISEEDLEKERNVVLEEWRERKSAQGRLAESYISALAKGCLYCERFPIGTEEVIRNVKAETLRKFYAKFYHPARMAVVAVGDFEGAAVVKTIESLFNIAPQDISPLPRVPVAEAPQRPLLKVPETEGVVVTSMTDPELSMATGIVDCKQQKRPLKTLQDCRRTIRETLFFRALNSRLEKLILEPKGARNFMQASASSQDPIPPLQPMSISVQPVPGRMRYAIRDVARELERVKRFGFYDTEIARAKKTILAVFEQLYIERDRQISAGLADEYVSFFLDDDPMPGPVEEARMIVTVVPSITSEEVSAVAAQFKFEDNVVVKLATPPLSMKNFMYSGWCTLQALRQLKLPGSKIDLPDDAEVAALLRGVKAEELEQWPEVEDDPNTRLQSKFESEAKRIASLAGKTAGGTSESRAIHAKGFADIEDSLLGEELILQNGLRIFLKDTNFSEDQILMSGHRWGGITSYQKRGWSGERTGAVGPEAKICTSAAGLIGICGMPSESLQECLDGKRCNPGLPSMGAYETTLEGSTSPSDLEFFLMIMNLIFVCPVDPSSVSRRRLTLMRLNLLFSRLAENRDPSSKFSKKVLKLITCNHPISRETSFWSASTCNFKRACQIFNECGSTPEDWTFSFVGKLPDKQVLVPLLEKYLGTIPSKNSGVRRSEMELREAIVPYDVPFPANPIREEVRVKMVDPRGAALIVFPIRLNAVPRVGKPETVEAELEELTKVVLLTRVLETRLVEVLRFQRGKVYGASVGSDFSLTPMLPEVVRQGQVRISFECDPAEAEELADTALAEVARLLNGSAVFADADVSAVLEASRREFEESILRNDYWVTMISNLYTSRGYSVIGDLGATISLWWKARQAGRGSFTAASAQDALRALLPEGVSSAVVTMKPKRSWWRAVKARLQRKRNSQKEVS